MKHLRLAAFACCAVSIGCVKQVRYRYFPDQSCGPTCVNRPARDSGPGWELAYAEFKDDGSAWDPLQTDRAVELIRQAKNDNNGAAVVLLYVHGWKNNANAAPPPERKDVEKFKTALDRVATMVSRPSQEGRLPPLVGIFIGWRGDTIRAEPLRTLTLWPRRAVARQVGRHALFESMGRIVDAAKPRGDDRTRLILVGHSFGSRVLENAIDGLDARQGKPGRMLAWHQELKNGPAASSLPPPADLVVFVNAATQSSISEKTIRRLQETHHRLYGPGVTADSCRDDPGGERRLECRPLPLYLAISSTGDLATRYLLPISNLIVPPAPLPLRLRAAAFTGRLRSHEAVEVECPPPVPYRCQPAGSVDFCFEANRDEQRVCYQVRRKRGATNLTPFWVMTVDPRVVTDHGDIWNQNLLDLFSAILERSRVADALTTQREEQRTIR
jgi:hypothetical protein